MVADKSDLVLPEGARMVHIGPPKTGSTAIQNALHAARPTLREHGVVYPGVSNRPREAGWAVLGMGVPLGRPPARIEAWHEFVREVRDAGDKRVCISNEDWGKADVNAARRIVEGLGGERVHVVSVVRRLDTVLPSTWQERVKARLTLSYDQWLQVVLSDTPEDRIWRNVWVPQDVEKLVDRWAQAVNRDRITLIVSDDSDRNLLPRTFEQMLGLPTGLLALDDDRSNRSLSMNEVELIRHVNQTFVANDWSSDTYRRLVQGGLLRMLKSVPRAPEEAAIPPLPPWAAERVAELSAQRADLLSSLGVRVCGDPDSLRTPATEAHTSSTDEPVKVSLALAARAVHGTIDASLRYEARTQAQHERKLKRTRSHRGRKRVGVVAALPLEERALRNVTTGQLLRVVKQRGLRRLRGNRAG